MKRIIVLMLVLVAGYSYGQKKPKINQAEKARSEGNLGEAKDIMDQAIEYEKLMDDGKTWYYHGLVYASLDTTSNPEYQSLAENPLKTAMESFAKADELGKNSGYYVSDAIGLPITKEQQIETLWSFYLNKGVENYQNDDNTEAYKYFEKTTVVKPQDTTGYLYAGSVAQAGKDYDKALKNYNHLINEMDYKGRDTFYSVIYIEGVINEDNVKALEAIRKAKTVFPGDREFAKSEISALVKLGRQEEAQKELETAIANEPDNANLIYTLGVMFDETGNVEKAKEAYKRSLEVDPNFLNARFNLAVLYYNEAVELIKATNNLGISAADQKKAKEMQANIDKSLREAMPQWEKVNELQPNDRTTLETLQYIYTQLKMYDKAEKVMNNLDELGDEG